MKIALEQLGFGPCHHMHEVIANPDKHLPFWLAAAKGEKIYWDEAQAGYESCVDWPTAAYWPALAEHFPDANTANNQNSRELVKQYFQNYF